MSNYNEIEVFYLNTLKSCLNAEYSSFIYEIGKYKEGACCLEKCEDEWQIYCGERGQKSHVKRMPDIESACLSFIDYMTFTDEDSTKITQEFKNKIASIKSQAMAIVANS